MRAPDPLLRVEGLSLATRSGLPIVEDLSFRVDRGAVLAIVGESGSGKTMAARAVIGLLPPGVVRRAGRILLEGAAISEQPEPALRALRGPGLGMVFQEPMVSLNPAMTIGAQMAEGLALHRRLERSAIRARCLDMLRRVGIGEPERCLSAYPHEFSGGMRQRIMLASVMLLEPKLLIADEPTTALDTLTQKDVLDLMVGLARDHGTAILLITHNLGLVARYAADTIVMEKGRLVEAGATRALLSAPREAYTKALVAALPRRTPHPPPAPRGAPMLTVRDFVVTHPGARSLFRRRVPKRAVDGVSLDVHPREIVAVVGGSGSGKTTLGRAILGLVPHEAGTLSFDGADPFATRAARRSFVLQAQMVFQDPYSSLDPRMRVEAIVREPLRHVPELTAGEAARRVEATLDDVGLRGFGRRYPHELSGGQRQRVAIARALVRRPRFVVADEPVSALDMTIQAQVLALFTALQDAYGFACLFISHDLAVVEAIADRIAVMQDGRVVETGHRDDIFDRPRHAYTRALLEAAPRLDLAPSTPVLKPSAA
ncbi:MAG TPA: ABC transporter ATP-binding protein [Beijerinckiaceae bacterium]|jgi:peptide/nickel transport system ATP-binding protein